MTEYYKPRGYIEDPETARMNSAQQYQANAYHNVNKVYGYKQTVMQDFANRPGQVPTAGLITMASALFDQFAQNGTLASFLHGYNDHQMTDDEAKAMARNFWDVKCINTVMSDPRFIPQINQINQQQQQFAGYQQMNPQNQLFGLGAQPVYSPQQPMVQPQMAMPQMAMPQVQTGVPLYNAGYVQNMQQVPQMPQNMAMPNMQQYGPAQPYAGYPQPNRQNDILFRNAQEYGRMVANGFGQVNNGYGVQAVNPNEMSVYTRHELRAQQARQNANATPTYATPKVTPTFTQPAPRAATPQYPKADNVVQYPNASKRMPERSNATTYRMDLKVETDSRMAEAFEAVMDELKEYLELEVPKKAILARVNEATKRGEIIGMASSVEVNVKRPVLNLEQAVREVIHDNEKEFFTPGNSFATIINANCMNVLDLPFTTAQRHFDAVMKVVEEGYAEHRVSVDPAEYGISVGSEEHDCINFDGYVDYAREVLMAFKEQGGYFTKFIGDKIIEEFNRAALVTLSSVNPQTKMVTKLQVDDLDELGGLCVQYEELDPQYRQVWTSRDRWYDAFAACLDASLFAVFRRGEKCYLNPGLPDDMYEIATCPILGLKTNKIPLKKAYSSFDAQTDLTKKEIGKTLSSVFVYTLRRTIVYHNLELKYAVKERSIMDDRLNEIIGEPEIAPNTAILVKLISINNYDEKRFHRWRRPVLLVKHGMTRDYAVPRMCGVNTGLTVLSQRTVL